MINTSYAGKFQVEIFVSFAQSLQILVSGIWLHFIWNFSIQNQQSTFSELSQICRFPKKYTLDQPQSVITGVHGKHLSQHLIDRRAATCVKSPGNNISCIYDTYMIYGKGAWFWALTRGTCTPWNKTLPQAKCQKPPLLLTSLNVLTSVAFIII